MELFSIFCGAGDGERGPKGNHPPVKAQHISDCASTISDSSDQDTSVSKDPKAKEISVTGRQKGKQLGLSISEKSQLHNILALIRRSY